MIITPQPVTLKLPDPPAPRSKGVHVSSIIRCIATETGLLKPEWAEELSLVDVRKITDPEVILRISIGLAWEDYYIGKVLVGEGVVDHPGEMKVDGIYMTHDGESVDTIFSGQDPMGTSQLIVHEVKATYKSTRTVGDLSEQWMWLTQAQAYCKGAKTRYAEFHVLFLCGDYKYPLKPQLKRWRIEFTPEEIDVKWELLRDYKEYREDQ